METTKEVVFFQEPVRFLTGGGGLARSEILFQILTGPKKNDILACRADAEKNLEILVFNAHGGPELTFLRCPVGN